MKVLIQGDSHTKYIENAAARSLLPKQHLYSFTIVHGATSLGLDNPNSKTDALNKFRNGLRRHKPEILVTQLGEVDCGFAIWYRQQKHGTSIEEQVIDSITNYFKYLEEAEKEVKHIIVTAPTLPSIKDGDITPEMSVANLRKEIKATQLERTELTLTYSEILKEKCIEKGYTYVDFNRTIMVDGVIDDKFLSKDAKDHHLNNAIIPHWAEHLSPVLNRFKG